jgi:hypothetical protein
MLGRNSTQMMEAIQEPQGATIQKTAFACHFILFGPDIVLSILLSDTLGLSSSLSVRD